VIHQPLSAESLNAAGEPIFNPFLDQGRHIESRIGPSVVYNSVDNPYTPRSGKRITVVLFEDHPLAPEGVGLRLRARDGFQVLAVAGLAPNGLAAACADFGVDLVELPNEPGEAAPAELIKLLGAA